MSMKKNSRPACAADCGHPGVVFGPVPSRRLGLSLGVDLVPAKTCSLDCIYCEAGRTTVLTGDRAEWIPTAAVLAELAAVLAVRGGLPPLDCITFSGAGEPTLHSGIGVIIRWLKEHHPEYRVCLLTNGTLFAQSALRQELAPLDLVVPSLDAADDDTFRRLNRPVAGLSCLGLPAAYAAFRRECPQVAFWLEIFVVAGINDRPAALAAIRDAVALIRPDKVQLNTLDRPGTEAAVQPADQASLQAFMAALAPLAPVEIVGRFTAPGDAPAPAAVAGAVSARIMAMLCRRPCTVADLAAGLGLPEPEVRQALAVPVDAGLVVRETQARGEFFRPAGSR
jgi:wyosine [tRNA(Phe)-imidazoG37] synthetase (radical SAM superfamily)